MKTNILLIYLILLVSCLGMKAQPINKLVGDVVVPPPTASSLGKYTDIPVSHFTGVPNISIPLYTVQDGKIALSINLSYHASGIRVNELASWTGIGWSLNAGGAISRTVMNLPDELDDALYEGFFKSGNTLNISDPKILQGKLDTEPDIFSFNFAGYAGKFFFDNTGAARVTDEQDFKIEKIDSPNNLDGFVIIVPDGTRYLFGTYGSRKAYDTQWSEIKNQPDVTLGGRVFRNTWYLLAIESHDQKDKIELYYTSEKYSYEQPPSCFYKQLTFLTNLQNCSINRTEISCSTGSSNVNLVNFVEGYRLHRITSSTQSLEFDALTDREDLDLFDVGIEKARRLDKIRVSTGSYHKSYDFSYSYFTDSSGSESYQKRLRLDSLTEKAAGAIVPPYIFEYNGDFLPNRYSKAIDHWGYYNAEEMDNEGEDVLAPATTIDAFGGSKSYGDANRDANADVLDVGVLTKVIYPTGGHTQYTYEAHDTYGFLNTFTSSLPLRYCGEDVDPLLEPLVCNLENPSDQISFSPFDIEHGSFKYRVQAVYPGINPIPNTTSYHLNYKAEFKEVGGTGANDFIRNLNLYLEKHGEVGERNGGDELRNIPELKPNILYEISVSVTSTEAGWNNSVGTLDFIQPILTTNTIGGLRIQKIKQHDGYDSQKDIIKTFEYTDGSSQNISSGHLFTTPDYGEFIFSSSGTSTYYEFRFGSHTKVPLGDYYGNHIGYERVVEYHNGNGKIVNEYKVESSVPYVYPLPPTRLPLEHGKFDKSTTYNENGQIVASNEILDADARRNGNPSHVAYKVEVIEHVFPDCNNFTLIVPFATQYPLASVWYRVTEQQSTLDNVTTTEVTTYDPNDRHDFPISTTIVNSDGASNSTHWKYAHEMLDTDSGNDVWDQMIKRNMLAQPLEQTNRVGGQLVDGNQTLFKFFDPAGNISTSINDPIYPYEFKRFETTWDENGMAIQGNWNTIGQIDAYDMAHGRPAAFTQRGWEQETYTWNTNGLVKTRKYEDFTWTYDYHLNTQLVAKVTDIDGQFVQYGYDNLHRLTYIGARNNKVSSTFTYAYKGINNALHNHVKTKMTYEPVDGSDLHIQESFQYYDGLGRPTQQVKKAYSPDNKDIITATIYDKQGRPWRHYEPFNSGATNGSYGGLPTGAANYGENKYYDSPLNRIKSVTPPGWNYPTTYTYGTNNNAIVANTSTYPTGTLFAQETTDGNGHSITTYTDRKGRLIQQSRPENTEIKYDYDPKDRLRLVIPPGATASSADLTYKYLYDERDNVVSKKIPGMDAPTTYLYDIRNLTIHWQDPEMALANRWLQTEHDLYGRAVKTGFTNYSGTPASLRPFDEVLTTTSFYTLGDPLINRGKIKEQHIKVLGTSDLLKKFTDYDEYGRLYKVLANNHLEIGAYNIGDPTACAEVLTFSYDFADNIVEEDRIHKIGNQTTYLLTTNQYDDEGRLREVYFDVGNTPQTASTQIANYQYTDKDELAQKNLGLISSNTYLQQVDYSYNPQGWLTHINPTLSGNDLFRMELRYDNPYNLQGSQVPTFNGNISQLIWQTKGGLNKTYGFSYDNLDRLTQANYYEQPASTWILPNGTSTYQSSYAYDPLGNITSLHRKGLYHDGVTDQVGQIDQLTYNYLPNTNRLNTITEAVTPIEARTQGFNPGSGIGTYGYDANGNMELDPYKDLAISYNHLNLPSRVEKSSSEYVDWLYDAAGNKLRKTVIGGGTTLEVNSNPIPANTYQAHQITSRGTVASGSTVSFQATSDISLLPGFQTEANADFTAEIVNLPSTGLTRDYVNGIEYWDGTIEAIYHAEGRIYYDASAKPFYQYYIKDHLSNNRLLIGYDGPDVGSDPDIIQENHHYPFGMQMKGDWNSNGNDKYLYNGKELNEEFGLGWLDFGFRWYDPAIGRFNSIDPLSELYQDWSSYHYTLGNPIKFNDPTGAAVEHTSNGVTFTGSHARMVFNILIGQTKSPEESSATSRETVNDEHVPCPDPPCGFDARQRFREKAVLNGTDPGGKQLIEGMQAEAQGALFGSAALKILRIPRALFKLAKFIKEARSSQITSKDIENVQKLISKAKMKKAFRYLNNLKLSNKDRKKVEVLHDKSKNSNLRFYEGLRSFDENNLSNNQVMDDLLKFLSKKKKKP